jgi:hypothetical protein
MFGVSQNLQVDGVPIVRLESPHLLVDVAPGVGGRIISLIEKAGGREFMWRNAKLPLECKTSGSEYDPNFYGGIDELLPNDIPETIDGVDCPDHGELWTTPLNWTVSGDCLSLYGQLPKFGLNYEREMRLLPDRPVLQFRYRVSNHTKQPRHFLWKLHAALSVQADDQIQCPARRAQVVDPAWSRFKAEAPFDWPKIESTAANIIPPLNGTMDVCYLFDLADGEIAWLRPSSGLKFAYQFDRRVFPYAWLFASYGGFLGHYTVILEPCTTMPMSVNQSAARNQCSLLEPGESIETNVSLYAGPADS